MKNFGDVFQLSQGVLHICAAYLAADFFHKAAGFVALRGGPPRFRAECPLKWLK